MCEKRASLCVCVQWLRFVYRFDAVLNSVLPGLRRIRFTSSFFDHLLVTLLLQPLQRRVVADRPVVWEVAEW